MPFDSVQTAQLGSAWSAMGSLAAADGSATHPWLHSLRDTAAALRDVSDAMHHIGRLHGRHPAMVDHALAHARQPIESEWIEACADAFAVERAYMVRIVAAAGPMPSTPGHAESEAAAAGQRHALDMLAQSGRAGCATGAVVALVIDWEEIRATLDAAAIRFGIPVEPARFPLAEETVSVVDALAREGMIERAMLFGAQQVYAQHRGLWDLLEARASARARH